jgi:tetratricopeptide (TPR) repeat protein
MNLQPKSSYDLAISTGAKIAKKLQRHFLKVIFILLFIFIFKPIYLMISNFDKTLSPTRGDYYLLDMRRLAKTDLSVSNSKKYSAGYQIFKIDSIDSNYITLSGGNSMYDSSYWDRTKYPIQKIKVAPTFDKDYFSKKRMLKIPRKKITLLNIKRIITYIYREKGSVSNSLKLGHYLFKEKEFLKASHHFKQATKFDKTNAFPLFMTGSCYAQLEDFDNALLYYSQAISVDESLKFTYGHIAHVYGKLGDTANALKYNQIALKMDPRKGWILNYLETLFLENNEFDKEIGLLVNNNKYGEDLDFLMKYHMLKIFFLAEKNTDVSKHLASWDQKYRNRILKWDFTLLDSWVQNCASCSEEKRELRNQLVYFFKSKSVAY